MSVITIALGVKALLRAARRAHERDDASERDRLLDEADEQVGLLIDAMPADRPRHGTAA